MVRAIASSAKAVQKAFREGSTGGWYSILASGLHRCEMKRDVRDLPTCILFLFMNAGRHRRRSGARIAFSRSL